MCLTQWQIEVTLRLSTSRLSSCRPVASSGKSLGLASLFVAVCSLRWDLSWLRMVSSLTAPEVGVLVTPHFSSSVRNSLLLAPLFPGSVPGVLKYSVRTCWVIANILQLAHGWCSIHGLYSTLNACLIVWAWAWPPPSPSWAWLNRRVWSPSSCPLSTCPWPALTLTVASSLRHCSITARNWTCGEATLLRCIHCIYHMNCQIWISTCLNWTPCVW